MSSPNPPYSEGRRWPTYLAAACSAGFIGLAIFLVVIGDGWGLFIVERVMAWPWTLPLKEPIHWTAWLPIFLFGIVANAAIVFFLARWAFARIHITPGE